MRRVPMSETRRTRLVAAGLLTLCALLYVADLGRVPLYNYEESKEALLVWEMVNGGGWILPLRNGVEQPVKPPLFHWLGALVALVGGGVGEFGVRFPSALAAAATVLATFLFGSAVWNWRVGLLAALILATCPEWVRWAIRARSDMLLVFFVTAAQFLFFRVFEERATRPRTLYMLYAAIGLAMLAKGPQGALLPGLVAVVFLWRAGDLDLLGHLRLGHGAAIVAGIALSWYLPALVQGGGEFFQRQILDENVFRFFSSDAGGPSRRHGLFYYLPTVFAGMLPWSLFFPAVAVLAYRCMPTDNRQRYLVCWLAVEFIFFTLASGKRSNYILPAYPALALLAALWWQAAMDRLPAVPPPVRRACRQGAVWLGGLAGLAVAALTAHAAGLLDLADTVAPTLHPRDRANLPLISETVQATFPAVAVLLGLLAAGIGWFVWSAGRDDWLPAFGALAVSSAALLYFTNAMFNPLLAGERTYKPFMLGVRATVRDAPLYFYGDASDYGAIFYAGRRVPDLPASGLPDPGPDAVYLLVRERDWPQLSERHPHVRRLGTSYGKGPHKRHRLVLAAALPPPAGPSDATEAAAFPLPPPSPPGPVRQSGMGGVI